MKSKRIRIKSHEQTLLTSMFATAGIALGLIFAVGFIVSLIIDASGALRGLGNQPFNWEIYRQLNGSGALQRIGILSIFSLVLILATFVMRLIWTFRIQTVSKIFIYTVYAFFIMAQGIGFGILFATWNAPELIAIFGVTAVLFGAMALIGYLAKNLSGLAPFLIVGTMTLLFLLLLNFILRITGIYSDNLIFIIMMLSTVLSLAYIAFDVWWIKRTSQYYAHALVSQDDRFRFIAFFAFILLTDFIWLLWNIIRWYQRIR